MPASIALSDKNWQHPGDQGIFPGDYSFRVLAEGDSWMDRSNATSSALPDALATAFDKAGAHSVFILNLARFGDTLRRIGETMQYKAGLGFWLNQSAWDAVIFSAGGNDFIDAAGTKPVGQGILRDLNGTSPPALGRDCLIQGAVDLLVNQYLKPNFAAIYDAIRLTQGPDVPLFLNGYDTPTARNAPAIAGGDAWLYPAYRAHGIPEPLWPDLTAAIFSQIQSTIRGWAQGRVNVFPVPTPGTLTPADPNIPGNSHDWLNEIHPNKGGWKKLAAVWYATMKGPLESRLA